MNAGLNVLILVGTFLLFSLQVCRGSEAEKKLFHDIFKNYDKSERPAERNGDKITVDFSINLIELQNLDEDKQELQTSLWLNMIWSDRSFKWNPDDYDGLTTLRIHPSKMWIPDIVLYNGAPDSFSKTYESMAVVFNQTDVIFIPPLITKSSCKLDLLYFPFDQQECLLKFGSWTYDGYTVDLQISEEAKGAADLTEYTPSQEWDLISAPAKRSEKVYPCCPEPYPDITYTLTLKRRSSFYVTSLILPEILLSVLCLSVFIVPAASGQKLTLASIVLLAMFGMEMYLQKVLNMNHGQMPIIGIFFTGNLILAVFAVLSSSLSIHFFHKGSTDTMSDGLKSLTEALSKLLYMGSLPKSSNYYSNLTVESQKEGEKDHDKRTLIPAGQLEGHLEWFFCSKVVDRLSFAIAFTFAVIFTFSCIIRMVHNV